MAAAAVCVLAPQSARAAVAICKSPADVPGQLLTAITTCFNCYKNGTLVQQVPCPPANPDPNDVWVNDKCYDFPDTPTAANCDRIASTEVSGCSKAVKDAAKCNDALNGANATAETADCLTLPDPGDQQACASSVAAELSALTESVKNAAAAGQQACLDLNSSVRAACLGESF
jgi:hypothetical protein